jgi:hypothetical protein
MPIPYDDTLTRPLTTSEHVLERAHDLVGPAIRAQTWMMFLDEYDVQLPLLVPVDEAPDHVEPLAYASELLVAMRLATSSAAMIAVIERPGSGALCEADRRWACALRDAARAEGIDLRDLVYSHDTGVRGLGPDDLIGPDDLTG